MRRVIIFGLAAVLALGTLTLGAVPAQAGGKKVAFTFAFADLGQGAWGGGPLYADGTARGNVPFSAGNGQLIAHFHPVSWTLTVFPPDPSLPAVDICFSTHEIKNAVGAPPFPPFFCLSDPGPPLPFPIGGPFRVDIDFDGKADILVKVTPVN